MKKNLKRSGIYEIRNITNGHVYIGQSANVAKRWWAHKRKLRKGTHKNAHLQSAWNLYGRKAFKFSVLLFCDEELLTTFEQRAMDAVPEDERYNMAPAADSMLGYKHTASTCAKQSAGLMGNTHTRGYVHTAETRAKMSASRMGHPVSIATRAKVSAFQKGLPTSPATRSRMAAAQKGNTNARGGRGPHVRHHANKNYFKNDCPHCWEDAFALDKFNA